MCKEKKERLPFNSQQKGSLRMKAKIKTLAYKRKLQEFVAKRFVLREILKKVFHI